MSNILEEVNKRDEALDYFGEKNKDRGLISPEYLYKLEEEKWYYRYREKLILQIIEDYFKNIELEQDLSDLDVVDIGVGTGKLSQKLSNIFGDIKRFDASRKYCDFAKDTLDIDVEMGDLPYDIALEEYNVVTLLNVLEYLIVPGLSLNSISAHLKDEGYLILSTLFHPSMYSQIDKENGMIKRYTKRDVEKLLKFYGFSVEYFSYIDYEIFKSAILRNLFKEGLVYPITKLRDKEVEEKFYRNSMFDLLKIKSKEELPFGRGGIFICKKDKDFDLNKAKNLEKSYKEQMVSGDDAGLLRWGLLENITDKYFKIEDLERGETEEDE